MFGTKRRIVSLSSTADDTSFPSRKAILQSPLGGQAAASFASSEVESASSPSLDRRKSARQHVRALNTEFARWAQSQLRDHPDELWEDGARLYLAQASEILENFTDVVNWLKANTGSEGNSAFLGTQSNEKKDKPQTNSNDLKSAPSIFTFGNAGIVPSSTSVSSGVQSTLLSSTTSSPSLFTFGLSASSQALSQSASAAPVTSWSSGVSFDAKSLAPVKTGSFSALPTFGLSSNSQAASLATTASFVSSTNSGSFSNSQVASFGSWNAGTSSTSQSTFTFGNQNPGALSDGVKEDADEDNEPEQPSSPSVKSAKETGIEVVLETKCKLYIKSTDASDKEPWKDKGAGKLFIKCQEGASKGTKESKPRILIRNDVGKIMLNASLYPGIKTHLQKNAIVTIFHTSDDSGENAKATARTFLIRVKNEEERNKLADVIREHAPAA